MNISLQGSEYKDILMKDYIETWSGEELILYFQQDNKIVVMNETATIIWRCIVDGIDNAKAILYLDDFVTSIKTKCVCDVPSDTFIIDDIIEMVTMFFSNRLLIERS